jgi:hypothetical protein
MSHDDLFYEALLKVGEEIQEDPAVEGADDPTAMVETVEGVDEESSEVIERVSSVTSINLFRNPDSHPIVLDLVLLKKYGIDWLGWENETLELFIPKDFRTPTIADINMEKVQACKSLHLVDTFWLQWEVFVPCCMALNGIFPDFDVLQAPTVAQAMVAVDIANRVRDDVTWSDEIKSFLSVVHRHDDILCPIDPLSFVKVDTTGLEVDTESVMARWPEVKRSGQPPVGDSMEDEQLRRLLVVHRYLEEDRSRLRAQLKVVEHV